MSKFYRYQKVNGDHVRDVVQLKNKMWCVTKKVEYNFAVRHYPLTGGESLRAYELDLDSTPWESLQALAKFLNSEGYTYLGVGTEQPIERVRKYGR